VSRGCGRSLAGVDGWREDGDGVEQKLSRELLRFHMASKCAGQVADGMRLPKHVKSGIEV
jgi:hypothetical protein